MKIITNRIYNSAKINFRWGSKHNLLFLILAVIFFSFSCSVNNQKLSKFNDIVPEVSIDSSVRTEKNNFVLPLYVKSRYVGTVFALSQRTDILYSAAHVLLPFKMGAKMNNQKDDVYLLKDNAKFPVIEIIEFKPELDFVSFKISERLEFQWVPSVSTKIHEGEIATIISASENDWEVRTSQGPVYGYKNDIFKPHYLYLLSTLPGMSGSPVLNSNNDFIGIHFGGFSKEEQMNQFSPSFLFSSILNSQEMISSNSSGKTEKEVNPRELTPIEIP